MSKTKDQIQDEAITVVAPLRRSGVAISMGVGKTLVGLRHMVLNYSEFAKFLVVIPRNTAIDTWKEEIVKHKLEYLLLHITFTTYLSLLKQDLDYDVVYLDECHSLIEESHDPWLSQYKNKILGLTGTPPKYHKSGKGKMVDRYCPIVYTYITDEAVEDGILNDYSIIVHTMTLDGRRNMPITKGGKTWIASESSTYEYWTKKIDAAVSAKEVGMMRILRMKSLMEFPSKERFAQYLFDNAKVKTILFANTQVQADRMCMDSVHSNNPRSEENLEKFKSGEILKLSSVLQLSDNVNIPGLKVGIIMHAYGNERKASQRIGRNLRLSPEDMALIHILCYLNTVDETWVKSALESFDQSKITWQPAKIL
jgi:superfamily II DNA or RNA helicase